MTLPSSGAISASMINVELGRAENAAFSLDDPAVRALAGKPTGAISFSDFHGKSSYTREPASGDIYDLPDTFWYTNSTYTTAQVKWDGYSIFSLKKVNVISHVVGTWRYHRGGWRSNFGGNLDRYGVWRETAGTDRTTYIEVREPEVDAYSDANNEWVIRFDSAEISVEWTGFKWGGEETALGTVIVFSYEKDGWTYHRGEQVFDGYVQGKRVFKYKVYRTKILAYVPPPFRDPEVGESYNVYRSWRRTSSGYNFFYWDDAGLVSVDYGEIDSFEHGDWVYYKGGMVFTAGGHKFHNIYRVKKADAADTKAREPATGEVYNSGTYWNGAYDEGQGLPPIVTLYWYGEMLPTGVVDGDYYEYGGWRYHKGAYVEDKNGMPAYMVWREEI